MNSTTTRASLVFRLRDARDANAWEEFVDLYAPLIHGFCRKQGLQDADASDLTQDAMTRVHHAIGRLEYDPRLGRFRGWLFTIVRNLIRDFHDRQNRLIRGAGTTSANLRLAQIPHPDSELEAQWEADLVRQLYARAAQLVRSDIAEATWKAFHATALEGRNPTEVTGELRISVAAVYLAKSRVMARLKAEAALLLDDGKAS